MAKQMIASVMGASNLFSDIRTSLTSGDLSGVTGQENHGEFQHQLNAIAGNESAIAGALKGFGERKHTIVASVLSRKGNVALPGDLKAIYEDHGNQLARVTGAEGFSMENFKGSEQEIKALNLTLNAQTHLQTPAAEALFPSVGIGYHDEALTLKVRAAGIGTYANGNTAFQSASNLTPLFSLLRSGDMYKDDVLSVYPVFPEDADSENLELFLDPKVKAPKKVTYIQGDSFGRSAHRTQMLRVPCHITNLLALTETPGQRKWTDTDELESNSISIKEIALRFKVEGKEVNGFIKTGAFSNTTFGVAGQGQSSDDRELNLRLAGFPAFSIVDADGELVGETLFAKFKTAGFEPLLKGNLTGNFQRQSNALDLSTGALTVVALRDLATGKTILVGNINDASQKALVKSVTDGTITGAEIAPNITNINRGNFGYRIEVFDALKHMAVKRRTPVSVKYPVTEDDVNQSALDFAITQMSLAINNQCSKHAFEKAFEHADYIEKMDGSPVIGNMQGSDVLAGQHFLSPTRVKRSLNLRKVVSAMGSSDVFHAISAAISTEICDIAAALNSRSGLAAVSEYSAAAVAKRWTVVTHQNLSRFIMKEGDARTVGPVDSLDIKETNFDSMIGRMFIVPTSESSSSVINPLAGMGICVTKENIVVQGHVTRNNTDHGVIMTLPTYQHWGLNVVVGSLEIEEAEELLGDISLINALAQHRVRVDNPAEFPAGGNVDPNAP